MEIFRDILSKRTRSSRAKFRRIFFNLWYFRNPPWDTGISPPELIDFINRHPAGNALDLGCGTGTNAITLAQHNWQVTGVDFSKHAIYLARKKAKHVGLKIDFRIDDVTSLSTLGDSYDLILDIGCFHGLSRENQHSTINNIIRLLSPQGTYLVYAILRPDGEPGPGLGESDLEKLLSSMTLVKRKDGMERGKKPSAWFILKR